MTGQIAYVREKNLYLLDLATRTTHQLTSDGKDSNPAWSPDGQWLAFARDSDIYKLRVEGTAAGALVQVTTTSEKELLPSYSREGTLFFIHMTTDDSGYPRYDIIGKTDDREYIAYNSAQSDLIGFFEPSSLDFFSDHLFALTEPQPSNVQVYVVDIASGEPHVSLISTSLVQRAPFSWVAYEGRWSHQKGELAFTASESSSSASSAGMLRSTMLGHKAFDGSNAPVIPIWSAEAGSDDWTSLDWSPDDQWLALARWRDDGLWVISAQGGEPQRIADVGSQPAWRPTVAISPPAATLPTTVTDLALTLGSESGTVQLTWTAPSSKEDVAALSYDLRYSEQPINEQTWDSAIEVANEPTVAATGSTQQMEIKNVPVGKIWYFAVKTLNGKGQGSAISNLPSLQDSRPLTTAGSTCTETSPYECTVAAKDDWLQTSLFVHKGDTFSITYLSGTWSIDIWQESLDNPWGSYISPYFDAEGSSEADSKQCGIVDTTSLSTLIGKIGNSPAFKVGNAKTMVATTDGNVFLRMNDTCQGDNDGAVVMKLAALRLITGKVTDGHGNPLVGVVVRLTDPSGHPVRIRRVDGTVIPELRTNTSNDGRYTITDEISLGTYKLEVLLEDTTGHKRVLYDILQQPVFIRTPIDIAANHQKYVQDFRLASEEKFETPLVDGYRDRLADLAAIYFQAWKVEDFIVNTLGYHSYKPIAYVRAFYDGEGANAQHFAKQPFEDSYINLPSNLSHLHYHEDWSSRILWHENFHHLQWQLSQDSFYDVPNFTGQHKGFRNATTRDSWVEGWAEFWTCVLADDRLFPVIAQQNILEPIDVTLEGIVSVSWINLEDNYKTWDFDENGTFGRESFAVAGILWDLYDSQNTLFDKDNIDLSRQNLGDFLLDTKTITNVYDLYQRMQAKLVGTPNEEGTTRVSASDLEQIFIQHGFYADVEWNQPPAWSDVWGRFQYHHHNTGEEAGWGGRPARRYSPPAIPGAFLKLTQAASLSANTTLTVTLSFDQPYYDYSYTVEAPGPSALIYVEPPPTRTLALVTVTASNGAQTSQPFTIDNQTYWQRVAASTTGYAAETTLTLAAANSPEVPIAGLRAVLSTVVVAGESAALAATADAGSAVTYTWDFGDGTNGEGAIVQHTYAAAGDYTATVTASNALSTVTQRVAVMVHAAAPVSEPTSVSPDRAAESGSSNAIPQTDDAPPVLAPIVAVLPPAVRPYWLAIGGGGAALVVLVLAGILWQGRARRARLARVVSTPAAQRRPAPPIAPPPSAPPPTLAPPSAPQPPADDLLQGLLANTPVPPPSAPADLPQALAAIKRGDLDAGSTLLREVTAREPGNADAWLNLGIIAVRRRDWDNARRCGLVARQLGHPQADTFLVWLHQQEAK